MPSLERCIVCSTTTIPAEKILVFTPVRRHGALPRKPAQIPRRCADGGGHGGFGGPDAARMAVQPERATRSRTHVRSRRKSCGCLIATDVLSEGQNLQDCAIVVNYDLPWAIIRLIQRAGRVDRIGQQAHNILCYSFLPADGIERLIRLRARVRSAPARERRSRRNGRGVLRGRRYDKPFSISTARRPASWTETTMRKSISRPMHTRSGGTPSRPTRPSKKKIEDMPNVVYSSKAYAPKSERPEGVLVYMRTAQGNDALAWMDRSATALLRASSRYSDRRVLARHACPTAS